jgi:hypothetical protein
MGHGHAFSRIDPKYGRDKYPKCSPRSLSDTIRACIRDYGEGKEYITLHRIELDLLLDAYDVLYRRKDPK